MPRSPLFSLTLSQLFATLDRLYLFYDGNLPFLPNYAARNVFGAAITRNSLEMILKMAIHFCTYLFKFTYFFPGALLYYKENSASDPFLSRKFFLIKRFSLDKKGGILEESYKIRPAFSGG